MFRLHYYNQVAGIISIISDGSVKHFLMQMLSLNRNENVTTERYGTKTTRFHYARHKKKDVQFEHFSVLNVPSSQNVLTLI